MNNPRSFSSLRTGIGFDFHRFDKQGEIRIGGSTIPGCPGLIGHSDADVLLHAAMDAVLGAAGEVDIGTLFPDTDDAFADADSVDLTKQVMRMVRENGFELVNLDAVLVCDRPKIAANRHKIRSSMAEALGVDISQINVKGKTTEGSPGRGEGVEAMVTVLVEKLR